MPEEQTNIDVCWWTFLVASFALYLVVAIWFIGAPGTTRNVSADFLLSSFCLLLALICDFGIAYALHQPGRRTFRSTFTITSGAIIVGAILVSLAVWRSHWFEMFRWIFQPSKYETLICRRDCSIQLASLTHKFISKERDTESNLDNFEARCFTSNLGRFISPDEFWKDSHVIASEARTLVPSGPRYSQLPLHELNGNALGPIFFIPLLEQFFSSRLNFTYHKTFRPCI